MPNAAGSSLSRCALSGTVWASVNEECWADILSLLLQESKWQSLFDVICEAVDECAGHDLPLFVLKKLGSAPISSQNPAIG